MLYLQMIAKGHECIFEPESLASQYAHVMLGRARERDNGDVEAFREVLLAATITQARKHSKYYGSILPEILNGRFPLEKLTSIQVLTRARLVEHTLDLRTSNEPGVVQSTTGTTGNPISVYRTESEVRFLQRFQGALQELLNASQPTLPPLVLNLANTYHGRSLDIPRRGYFLTTSLFDPVLLDQIERWLITEHAIPDVASRVSKIVGLYHHVEWLTYMLKVRGFDFAQCTIERIFTSGGYLTSRWKAILERTWSAQVIPVYSLTEIFTYANLCVECGHYHFLPDVIAELVNPFNHGPLDGTVGELLLTGLFPFNQGQPAIRYATGDLFRQNQNQCWQGDGYRFAGRIDHSVILRLDTRPPVVIGSAELLDVFDEFAELLRSPFLRNMPGITGGVEIGRPACTVELIERVGGRSLIRFVASLMYDTFLFKEATEQCERRMAERIRQAFPELDQAIEAEECEIEVRCVGAFENGGLPGGAMVAGLEDRHRPT